MDAEPLAAACELAFAVARDGEKAVPPVEPPASMRNYLYVAQLPRRAMTVAQRAIDEDPTFRRRVAAQATEQSLGRTGFLWLTRPAGWETDGQAPSDESTQPRVHSAPRSPVVPAAPSASNDVPAPPRPAVPVVPIVAESSVPAQDAPTPIPARPASATQFPAAAATPPTRRPAPPLPATSTPNPVTPSPSASSIEDELASLRGLVDQLSAERDRITGTPEAADGTKLDSDSGAQHDSKIPSVSPSAEIATDLKGATTERPSEPVKNEPASLDPAITTPAPLSGPAASSVPPVPKPRVKQAAARPSGLPIPPVPKPSVIPAQPLTPSTSQDTGPNSAELKVARSKVASLDGELDSANTQIAELEHELKAVRSELTRAQSDVVTAQVDLADLEGSAAEATRVSEVAQVELRTILEASELTVTQSTTQLESANNTISTLQQDLEQTKIELETANETLASTAAQSADLLDERDKKSSELDDLRHDYSVAAGAMVERDHLRESLDATTRERDELAGKVEVAEQARIDLERELEQMSGRWQNLQVELASARSSLTGTRGVFESSMQTIGDELAKTESILDGSAPEEASFVAIELDQSEPSAPEELFEVAHSAELADALESTGVDVSAATVGDVDTGEKADVEAHTVQAPTVAADEQPVDEQPVIEQPVIEAEVASAADPIVDPFAHVDVSSEFGVDPQAWIGSPDDVVEGAGGDVADPSAFAAAAGSEVLSEFVEAVGQSEDVPEPPALNVESSDLSTMLDTYGLGAEDSYAGLASSVQSANASGHELRQQIEIPASIADDPLGIIRHVVAAEDVVILVDGDAVAEMGWPETGVAVRREALVKYLGDLAADTGAAQDTVFSGSLSEGDELPVSRAVRVRITAPGVRPADALAELVDSYPQEWPVAVVSDDAELGVYASTHGATVLANGQLLDLLFDRWEASQTDE